MATMPRTFRPPTQQTTRERGREHDARRADQPWRAWYKTRLWQNRRAMQLIEEPLCQLCARRNIVEPATVVDHEGGHRGDRERFFWGPVRSVCKPCHDGEIQREEARARKS